ncbi:hypothetical protein, partial [Brucella sp. 22210]|uniref:hypothetical protein n=1 Tax=Brucella sp. 22210 TaxID=3453892 RepID=UPI003F876C45
RKAMAVVKRGAMVVHAILSTAELYNKVNVTVPSHVQSAITDHTTTFQCAHIGISRREFFEEASVRHLLHCRRQSSK